MVPLSGCFSIGHFIGQTHTVNKDLCGSNISIQYNMLYVIVVINWYLSNSNIDSFSHEHILVLPGQQVVLLCMADLCHSLMGRM